MTRTEKRRSDPRTGSKDWFICRPVTFGKLEIGHFAGSAVRLSRAGNGAWRAKARRRIVAPGSARGLDVEERYAAAEAAATRGQKNERGLDVEERYAAAEAAATRARKTKVRPQDWLTQDWFICRPVTFGSSKSDISQGRQCTPFAAGLGTGLGARRRAAES